MTCFRRLNHNGIYHGFSNIQLLHLILQWTKMKKHLNKNILPSQEQLHAELDLEPFVNCPSIEENNTMLAGKTTAYYELLAYIEQIMEQEDSLKIDDLTFTQFRNDT